ncbi:MAG TPA: hypothetical protein VE955_08460 [Candidatus Dormibacteraeota bacterium]|jgi:hypothetical protein|nr:hypothetical protein [Candidatus Dormibacteraeota bacterium]
MDESISEDAPENSQSIVAAEENNLNIFEQMKTSKRQETISKLSSLLTISYERAKKAKQPRIQQKWIAMCGYISQVLGRIVTDLEYERMRSDVEKLTEPVAKNVASKRTTIHRLETTEGKRE